MLINFIFLLIGTAAACSGPIVESGQPCWAHTCCRDSAPCLGGVCVGSPTQSGCAIESGVCASAADCCSELFCYNGKCVKCSLRTTAKPGATTAKPSGTTTKPSSVGTTLKPSFGTTAAGDIIRGYYSWSWSDVNNPARPRGPSNPNMGVAFSGWNTAERTVGDYDPKKYRCCPELPPNKWVSVGGGNANGHFTLPVLQNLATPNSIDIFKRSGYIGVMFDVEELVGPASQLIPAFQAIFTELKKVGVLIGVTMSHTGPYKADTAKDAADVAKFLVAHKDVVILSPQLYSYNDEPAVQLDETYFCKAAGCTWDIYVNTTAKIVPSVINESHYLASLSFFAAKGIKIWGFVQWAQ